MPVREFVSAAGLKPKPIALANSTISPSAESLPLNLEKTVKDRNTLHHLNSLHLHLHLTYGELLKERQSLLNSLHPHTSPQRSLTEELCAVRKNMVTRSATDTEVTKHAIRCFNRRGIGQRGDVFRLHPHKWSNRRNKH
ncbi:hypothetical protein AALO_G00101190 [Alosa alosa]|uniref:Uncharacterized protein n=1 Tax=Alosa alosa TaxID=278164 RepID=A0AAV6GU22_9TELE|nr:hypothetical protein AALO_G00101190 [Alosa alosa]